MTPIADALTAPVDHQPPAELIRRFAGDLSRLWPEGGRLGLAVSGGADSMAMLLLADAVLRGQFEVATVNHGLRAESARECAMVQEICAARSIPCALLNVNVASGNRQDRARRARYMALGKWASGSGLDALATAHHADDQAETFLMRLANGSGVAGLAGVRGRGKVPHSEGLLLLRPLLGFTRKDCELVVSRAGLTAVQDPSNEDDAYLRARIRKALRQSPIVNARAVAVSAANLADADEALEWAARREWEEQVSVREGEIRYRCRPDIVPKAITMRVIARAIALIGGEPRGQAVAGLLARLEQGRDANVAGVIARISGDAWIFRAEPPRRTG